MKKQTTLALGLILTSSVALADAPFFTASFEAGGDTLAELTDGTELTAGGDFYLALGYEVSIPNSKSLSVLSSIGWKYGSLVASDGDADLTRFPLELIIQSSVSDKVKLGAGLSYHLAPTYNETSPGIASLTIDFDNALGFVLQGGYSLSKQSSIGVRFTAIDYKINTLSFNGSNFKVNDTIDASSFGLFYNYNF
ncbi:MAG: outer membrane beta-barrel protein [Gammaproteobacteria bacterium]|nr:outer membrane beta-barrel protein [Gammaproteobacteria bacterium]